MIVKNYTYNMPTLFNVSVYKTPGPTSGRAACGPLQWLCAYYNSYI